MIVKKHFGKIEKIKFVIFFLIFCRFSKIFNMHLKHLENSESTAWNVIRMIINENFLNQNSKANLVSIETGLKIELDLISVQNLF